MSTGDARGPQPFVRYKWHHHLAQRVRGNAQWLSGLLETKHTVTLDENAGVARKHAPDILLSAAWVIRAAAQLMVHDGWCEAAVRRRLLDAGVVLTGPPVDHTHESAPASDLAERLAGICGVEESLVQPLATGSGRVSLSRSQRVTAHDLRRVSEEVGAEAHVLITVIDRRIVAAEIKWEAPVTRRECPDRSADDIALEMEQALLEVEPQIIERLHGSSRDRGDDPCPEASIEPLRSVVGKLLGGLGRQELRGQGPVDLADEVASKLFAAQLALTRVKRLVAELRAKDHGPGGGR